MVVLGGGAVSYEGGTPVGSQRQAENERGWPMLKGGRSLFFSFRSSLKLSDTHFYEPQIRALLGTREIHHIHFTAGQSITPESTTTTNHRLESIG